MEDNLFIFNARSRPGDEQLSVETGTLVSNLEECTFRAFRPGYFLGDDPRTKSGLTSGFPQVILTENTRESNIALSLLGSLNRLPIEILLEILPTLDLPSLISFRKTNICARNLVDSMAMFRSVVLYPELISAVLKLRCHFFDLNTLFACIIDPKCSFCGHFGDLLYLITYERWCFDCFHNKGREPFTLPYKTPLEPLMTDIEALEKFGHIPHVVLPPGTYGLGGYVALDNYTLAFDQPSFLEQQGVLQLNPLVPITVGAHSLSYATVIRAPYFEEHTGNWDEGSMCCACSFQGWEVLPFCQAISIGYEDEFSSWEAPWRRYTQEGMREHLEHHGHIIRIQKSGWGERYAHEYSLNSRQRNPSALCKLSEILRQCRDKTFPFPLPRLYCPSWRGVWTTSALKPSRKLCRPT